MLHQIWYFVKYESIFNSTPKIDIISKNVTRFTNLFEKKKTHPTKTYIFLYINKLNEFPWVHYAIPYILPQSYAMLQNATTLHHLPSTTYSYISREHQSIGSIEITRMDSTYLQTLCFVFYTIYVGMI